MRSMKPTVVVAIAALSAMPLCAQDISGTWSGEAALEPDSGLPVSVRIKVRHDTSGVSLLFSLPESRLVDLALPSPYSDSSSVTWNNGRLRAEFTPDIGLSILSRIVPRDQERIILEGRVTGDSIVGTIQITTFSSPIVLRLEPPRRSEPAIHFTSTTDSMQLGGKLVLPQGAGPHPAAIFVTGSDPDTRDAWLFEARALAAGGIASLLYDKRGVGESAGASHDLASWDDLAGDVEGAVAYLRSRPDLIDADRIGLIGQSQGTWIIAKVAARDPRIRFVVSIAGSGISAAEQETYRTGALMAAAGFGPDEIARAHAFQAQKFAVAGTGLGWAALDSAMQRLRADSVRWFPGFGTGAATRNLATLRLFGVLQFNYDPYVDLTRIRAPVLVIMGERDLVFPPQIVVERMQAALAAGGNTRFHAVIVPGASHGLGLPQDFRGTTFRRGMISPLFLDTLAGWVARAVAR